MSIFGRSAPEPTISVHTVITWYAVETMQRKAMCESCDWSLAEAPNHLGSIYELPRFTFGGKVKAHLGSH